MCPGNPVDLAPVRDKLAQGRFDQALAAAKQVTAQHPHLAWAWHLQGVGHFKLGQYDAAASDFAIASQHAPQRPEPLYDLAVSLAAARRWAECQDALASCAERHQDWARRCAKLLVQVGRLQATDEAYSHIHRIKNVLGVLAQRTDRMAQRVGPMLEPADQRRFERVVAAHEAAYEDVVATLKVIAVQPLALERADVSEMVSRCLFAASGNIGPRQVITRFDPDAPRILCDPSRIQEAFLCIIVNACEATAAEDVLSISTWRDTDRVCIAFADTGLGVPAAARESIFQMGYTTKPNGTGFGLAYVKQIVDRHRGAVRVQSTEGQGSMFTIELPIEPAFADDLAELRLCPLPDDIPAT